MTDPAYPAARAVAATVQAHFERHHRAAREQGHLDVAPMPHAAAVESMIDAAFWASLRREEGHAPKISLAYVPVEQAGEPMVFERRLSLSPEALTRLAPAVERPGIHLGVWHDGDALRVWGATRAIPTLCLVVEVVEPGLLVIKHRRGLEAAKFANVAVLHGDQVKVVDESAVALPDCPALLTSLLAVGPDGDAGTPRVTVQLAVSMRAHGRGGSLLVVPSGNERWRDSILRPIAYEVTPPFTELAELLARADGRGRPSWRDAVVRAVDAVAGLTAVDGATLVNDRYELLAFGAKIGRPEGHPPVEQVVVTEPVRGASAATVHPGHLGGTRHLSAAQFVHDQRDAVALVASQDGRFTIFAWSPCEERVQAHRVDALLM